MRWRPIWSAHHRMTVVLAPPGTVLKTSSGKIRRAASREIFEKGNIGKGQRSVSWQVARLALASITPQIRRSARYAKAAAYAVYCWLVYGVAGTRRLVICHPAAGLFHALDRHEKVLPACWQRPPQRPSKLNGLENLPADGRAYVLVSNHASYLDAYVLVAMLPGHFHFVAKAELAESFIIRVPLQHIHTEFVERFDIGKSVRDTRHLSDVLKAGHALMFFAEGTFTRTPGLMPFHLGAFSVAAQAGAPVIPVAIRGTRSILRSGSWFPHHGAISVDIGPPIDPTEFMQGAEEDTWRVAIGMRDRSREFILRHCGEPDLAQ